MSSSLMTDTCRISNVSKKRGKALKKRRKECSLWNRNTHIKKEYSLHHGTGTLIKRNSSKGTLILSKGTNRNTHIKKEHLLNRNTYEKELKGILIKRNTHIIKRNTHQKEHSLSKGTQRNTHNGIGTLILSKGTHQKQGKVIQSPSQAVPRLAWSPESKSSRV